VVLVGVEDELFRGCGSTRGCCQTSLHHFVAHAQTSLLMPQTSFLMPQIRDAVTVVYIPPNPNLPNPKTSPQTLKLGF
jgi:hypothetical protein